MLQNSILSKPLRVSRLYAILAQLNLKRWLDMEKNIALIPGDGIEEAYIMRVSDVSSRGCDGRNDLRDKKEMPQTKICPTS